MSKIILLLMTLVLTAFSLLVTLTCIVIAVNEKDFISLIYFCIMLSIILIILIQVVVEIFKLD